MNPELKKFLTPQAVVHTLEQLPELKTPVMDLLFADRRNHASTIVGKDDLGLPVENLPIVRRDSQSYPIEVGERTFEFFEPQPVKPNIFIPNAQLNDFVHLAGEDKSAYLQNKIDTLRRGCRATAEALCIQSLTGKVNYPLYANGQVAGTYIVDFGTIGDVSTSVTKKWDATGIKPSDIIKNIPTILENLKSRGVDANDVLFLVGYDVYAALVDIVGAQNNSALMTTGLEGVNIGGGLKFTLLGATYKDLKTKTSVPVVPAKHMLVVDRQAGHKLLYAALDSLEAGLQAMPFFVTQEETKDPAGIKLIGESKPFPIVNIRGIAKAQVLT